MNRIIFAALALALIVGGCKKDEDDNTVGPVWILNVNVIDGAFPNREIPNCARVKWKYSDEIDDRDVGCRNSNNFVKVWQPISENVTIFYRVECEGYTASAEDSYTFMYDLVDTLADGQEVIHNETVRIYPE